MADARTCKTRAGSHAIILMEDNEYLYGVYQADVLYPGRWYKTGHYMPQEKGEYKTALDLLLPTAVKVDSPIS